MRPFLRMTFLALSGARVKRCDSLRRSEVRLRLPSLQQQRRRLLTMSRPG